VPVALRLWIKRLRREQPKKRNPRSRSESDAYRRIGALEGAACLRDVGETEKREREPGPGKRESEEPERAERATESEESKKQRRCA
jgi:hypothetical protein